MKTISTFLFLLMAIAGFGQGHQNMINMVPAVDPASIYGAKLISYVGNHRIAAFFPRKKHGTVTAGIDLVVSDINGNIILTQGIAMDSTVEIMAGGGCNDGGYYIVAKHKDRSYTKFQDVLIKLDSLGQIVWNSAIEYANSGYHTPSAVVEDESGNFYVKQDGYKVTSLVSFRADGTYRWGTTFTYDSTSVSCIYAMCLTGDSGIMCIGQSKKDKVLSVVNYNGSIRWAKTFHTDSCSVNYTFIHKTRDGGYIAGGSYDYEYIYPAFVPYGSGLCKFDQNGNVEWETYFYDNAGCQTPSALDAVQNWDGRYSVIGSSYGLINFIFDSTGGLQGYLKSNPTHNFGSLHYVDQHIIRLSYSDIFSSILTSQDTMQCAFFESDHVLYVCSAYNNNLVLAKAVTDSNHRIVNNAYTLVPNNIHPFTFWPITTANVTYTGSALVECTPPLHHSGTDIDTTHNTTSVNETGLSEISVYPNPTARLLYIDLPPGSNIDAIRLFDIAGKLMMNRSINTASSTLDMSSYSDGIYFVHMTNSSGHTIAVRKVIIQR